MPLLQCLHVIGRDQAPDTESNALGMLRSILVRNAPVLTLHIGVLEPPLVLPALRHMMLDIGTTWAILRQILGWYDIPVASLLRGLMASNLESLYVRCPDLTISGPTDLTAFVCLQRVVTQGVRFTGFLYLPRGCLFHALSEPYFDREGYGLWPIR